MALQYDQYLTNSFVHFFCQQTQKANVEGEKKVVVLADGSIDKLKVNNTGKEERRTSCIAIKYQKY